jgi:hypothetical protein
MKSNKFQGFLSPHSSTEDVASIQIEPNIVLLAYDHDVKSLRKKNGEGSYAN